MAMPSRITTTKSLATPQGEMCAVCKQRVPVVYIADGVGKVCPTCDPKPNRPHLVELVDENPPAPED